jgi:anti-sigma B factor antagonist
MGSGALVSEAEVTTVSPAGSSPAVIRVAGDLDLAVVPGIDAAFAAVEAEAPDAIALDLSDVTHLDSTGLRVLLEGTRRARGAGRRFIVVAPPEGPVGRILRLTLLLEHLDVVSDLRAATA